MASGIAAPRFWIWPWGLTLNLLAWERPPGLWNGLQPEKSTADLLSCAGLENATNQQCCENNQNSDEYPMGDVVVMASQ